MTPPAQLSLEFEPRPALGGDDFLVAPCNAEAVAWLDRWPDWPSPALVIHGAAGCGKTHLCQVFLAATGGRAIAAEEIGSVPADRLLADGVTAAAVDGADLMVAAGCEEDLLHLYNLALETGRKLLLTAETPPARWDMKLADLSSRLTAAAAVEIGPPDDPLIAALLVKLFADRQLRVDEAVVTFLLARIERSFDAVRRVVAAIDAAALAEKRNITVPLVRGVLLRMEGDPT